ncbi:hypothetical protein RW1_062_00070 [Rhodococcus wratislaviensis NBRC 100605]|uniref:Uncharacterized protein n=1 Tax=Rhodococcus wratislaviensis NBRC 100605 TaxID=1219028 RepID=X0PZ84_RHOWR|nr:hypothetical protein RW1_062_00070 [Rhodococcus wratislaviensis NBRC 100605]
MVTYADTHHTAIITDTGLLIGSLQCDTTTVGYQELADWVQGHGVLVSVGVERTTAYGAVSPATFAVAASLS